MPYFRALTAGAVNKLSLKWTEKVVYVMESRKEDVPVFLDPRGRRWAFFRIILSITVLAVIIVFSDFLWGLQQTPDLPSLLLPKNTPNFRYLPFNPKSKIQSTKMFSNFFQGKYSKRYKQTGKIPLYAFFVNWDDTSSTSLEQHIEAIDVLVPEWLHLGVEGKLEIVSKKERLEQIGRAHV